MSTRFWGSVPITTIKQYNKRDIIGCVGSEIEAQVRILEWGGQTDISLLTTLHREQSVSIQGQAVRPVNTEKKQGKGR